MNFVYRLTWLVCRLIYATYFRWRVFHPERVPRTGPVILAANHASYIDPPLVGSGVSRAVNYLARESLFKYSEINASYSLGASSLATSVRSTSVLMRRSSCAMTWSSARSPCIP